MRQVKSEAPVYTWRSDLLGRQRYGRVDVGQQERVGHGRPGGRLGANGVGRQVLAPEAGAAAAMAPSFEVDPLAQAPAEPLDLGLGHWGAVDSRDHVYVIHRRQSFNERGNWRLHDPPRGVLYSSANILEFSPDGTLVNTLEGRPRPTTGRSNHGITVDHKDNIWIGGNGRNDAHI